LGLFHENQKEEELERGTIVSPENGISYSWDKKNNSSK